MKTKIILIIGIFFSVPLCGQLSDFAPMGAEWYYNYGYQQKEHFYRVISEKDTVVAGSNCRLLRQYYDISNIDVSAEYIIKQEQGKVYYYQDQFNLLFDFDVEVNDTVKFTFKYLDLSKQPVKDTVYFARFKVKSVTVNTLNLKVVTLRVLDEDVLWFDGGSIPPSEYQTYSYTEKIGLQRDFMPVFDNGVHTAMENFPYLRCYSEDNFSFVSDNWAATSLPCNYSTALNSVNTLKNEENIKIFPNPFTDNISIITNAVKYLEIIDIFGKIIYSSKISNELNEISTSNFPSGIYFVKLFNNSSLFLTYKIIKI